MYFLKITAFNKLFSGHPILDSKRSPKLYWSIFKTFWGERSSGFRRYNYNWMFCDSNPTRCSAGIKGQASLLDFR